MGELTQLTVTSERPKAPKLKDLKLQFSDKAIAQLDAILTHYPDKKSCIIPALWIAQREYGGWLPPEAMLEVSARLNRTFAEVEGVATFYTMFNVDHPVGRHMIEVCTCLTCHMCGAYKLASHLKKKLGIDFGETTEDGVFTLHEVECLDACDRAPLLQVGDQYHGPMDEAKVDVLLDKLRTTKESTVVQLADEVVKVHLMPGERN